MAPTRYASRFSLMHMISKHTTEANFEQQPHIPLVLSIRGGWMGRHCALPASFFILHARDTEPPLPSSPHPVRSQPV